MAAKVSMKCDVLVVGKTGAGKSTVANHILGKNWFKVSSSVQSVPTEPSFKEITQTTPEGKICHIRMIDTPGFFDTRKQNSIVLEQLKSYLLTMFPDGVNLVYFVFKANRFTSEERETFDIIIRNFKDDISTVSALIITDCESWGDDERQDYIAKFRMNPDTSDIAAFMQKGIYCVGFPDLSKMKPKLVKTFEVGIKEDAEVIRRQVYLNGEKHSIRFNKEFWLKWRQFCQIL